MTATIGTAWGCPFEGEVPIERLIETAAALADSGIDELATDDHVCMLNRGDFEHSISLSSLIGVSGEVEID